MRNDGLNAKFDGSDAALQLSERGAELLCASTDAAGVGETVYVVDDDGALREVIAGMLQRAGLAAQSFESADAFLAQYVPGSPGCLITDLRMPGIDGLSLVRRLKDASATLPVIVVTGSGDMHAAVEAMHLSAVDVLPKPFDAERLCARVRQSLELDSSRREELRRRNAARALLNRLTPREREILQLIVDGLDNRQIALRTQTSERAVEAHRARIAKTLLARNDFELVRVTLAGAVADA
jgi:two-component system response regulator FixJ